jgi:farnesyl-diphosphate farnesyltransferase
MNVRIKVNDRKIDFDGLGMLRLVSRTFALGIEQLPGLLRESITIAYLMFRVSDFLEDNAQMEPQRKVELLELWAAVMRGEVLPVELTHLLHDTDPEDPEAQVARHADDVLALLGTLPEDLQGHILEEVVESTRGMARWQLRGPVVDNEADMDDYMFEVAGRVGHMLTQIFAWHAKPIMKLRAELMPLSREFGLALQTVNIIRNMREDFERGWIFVPESFCVEVGIKRPEMFDPERLEDALQVVEALADKAQRHLHNGLIYIQKIPRRYHRIRLFCMWPLFFAVRTLALSRRNRAVLESEAKISRAEVKQIMAETQMFGWSNTWLDSYFVRLSEPVE